MSVGRELRACRRLGKLRVPHAGRAAPADQLLAIAHRARLGRALAPSERLGPFAKRLSQRLAGVGRAIHRIDGRVVDEPELERIDLGLIGHLVDRHLEQRHAGRRPRRAHVRRGRGIDLRDGIFCVGIRAVVVHQPPSDDVLHIVLVARGGGGRRVADRGELAGRLRAQRDALDRLRAVGVAEHLIADHRDPHRALQLLGRKDRQEHLMLRPEA